MGELCDSVVRNFLNDVQGRDSLNNGHFIHFSLKLSSKQVYGGYVVSLPSFLFKWLLLYSICFIN